MTDRLQLQTLSVTKRVSGHSYFTIYNALQWRYNALMNKKDTRAYLGVYGAVVLRKVWCHFCDGFSFVRKGLLTCCSERAYDVAERWKRESAASGLRQKPAKEYQRAQLILQHHRCFYCQRRFDSSVMYKNRLVLLRIHWDHLVPFTYLQTNPEENFVAACHLCNGIKADKVFQSVEEARTYVHIARALKNKSVS